jgi:hypothetical protein
MRAVNSLLLMAFGSLIHHRIAVDDARKSFPRVLVYDKYRLRYTIESNRDHTCFWLYAVYPKLGKRCVNATDNIVEIAAQINNHLDYQLR